MDFKWEMQERIDAGMNPMDAYYETRDSYAEYYDDRDKEKIWLEDRAREIQLEEDLLERNCNCWEAVCTCTCDNDCECKTPELTQSQIDADIERYGKIADWR